MTLFAVLALALAALSVFFWRQESELFLVHMRRHHAKRGDLGFLTGVLTGFPRLLPLILDISITAFILTLFGLGGGILGAVVGLMMSNVISFFINREVGRYTRKAPEAASKSGPKGPIGQAWSNYEDWWWEKHGESVWNAQQRAQASQHGEGA